MTSHVSYHHLYSISTKKMFHLNVIVRNNQTNPGRGVFWPGLLKNEPVSTSRNCSRI